MKTVSEALDFIRNVAVDRADYAVDEWSIDDVIDRAKEQGKRVTKKQARKVINLIDRKTDANVGINWDMLDYWTDDVLQDEAKEKKRVK